MVLPRFRISIEIQQYMKLWSLITVNSSVHICRVALGYFPDMVYGNNLYMYLTILFHASSEIYIMCINFFLCSLYLMILDQVYRDIVNEKGEISLMKMKIQHMSQEIGCY